MKSLIADKMDPRAAEIFRWVSERKGEDYAIRFMDEPLGPFPGPHVENVTKWTGTTPKQLARQTSQSLEVVRIYLGYMDPITKRPLSGTMHRIFWPGFARPLATSSSSMMKMLAEPVFPFS